MWIAAMSCEAGLKAALKDPKPARAEPRLQTARARMRRAGQDIHVPARGGR
jgi:hypothetical protein